MADKYCSVIFMLIVTFVFMPYFSHAKTNEVGMKFLEKLKTRKDLTFLPSGVMYKILRNGRGIFHPTTKSKCASHHSVKLIDGTIVDSTYSRNSPTILSPKSVLKGLGEVMKLMVRGDKWRIYLPSEVAFGDRGNPPTIRQGSVVIFVLEIISIRGGKKLAHKCKVSTLKGCTKKEKKFVKRMNKRTIALINKELLRLKKMQLRQMKPRLRLWLQRRVAIIKQIRTRKKRKKKSERKKSEAKKPEAKKSEAKKIGKK